ncbi:MAG: hypothetical protein M0Z94_17650, partial [Dehalococcoidales bacterium]|nr:hypothetical protein [Dehalococcoidales bacterium]
MSLERDFDATFTARLALREKQIQQAYRPTIGVHKWFARRPGTVFRSLLLSEFNGTQPIDQGYWQSHTFGGIIADPFMGGGTPLIEANRLGFGVIGADINPMAYWIVRQSLARLNLTSFTREAERACEDVGFQVAVFYTTKCLECGRDAEVKYFLWVKVSQCPNCGRKNDLFPGYLLAESVRHPRNVLVCANCGALNEYDSVPTKASPGRCSSCGSEVTRERTTLRGNRLECPHCGAVYHYQNGHSSGAPEHRMWAIEYHCEHCKRGHAGRFFKAPDSSDLARFEAASNLLSQSPGLPIPTDEIPSGDETDRLHRWGYRYYSEMFNRRQLL